MALLLTAAALGVKLSSRIMPVITRARIKIQMIRVRLVITKIRKADDLPLMMMFRYMQHKGGLCRKSRVC